MADAVVGFILGLGLELRGAAKRVGFKVDDDSTHRLRRHGQYEGSGSGSSSLGKHAKFYPICDPYVKFRTLKCNFGMYIATLSAKELIIGVLAGSEL